MRRDFRYTASGLQNVVIRNMEVVVDDEGCEVYTIPNILGVHKVVERAVVKKGQIAVAPMMNTSIGFDHRVVDGELAVKFLRRFCELLEKPELLWFHA